MNGTISPIQTPEQVLAAASSEALLDAIVRLTHVIHTLGNDPTPNHNRLFALREQRRLAREEVLRRLPRSDR